MKIGLRRFMIGVAALLLARPAFADEPAQVADVVSRQIEAAKSILVTEPAIALARSVDIHDRALALAPGRQRTLLVARADWLHGAALIQLNRAREAMELINRALSGDLKKIEPDGKLAGDLLMARGFAQMVIGRVEGALPDLQQAHRIFIAVGDRRSEAIALQNIGSIYLLARDFNHALQYYSQAAETYRADPVFLAALYDNRAHIYMEQGKFIQAESGFAAAVVEARRMGSVVLQARFLGSLALAQLALHKVDQADATINRAFALSRGAPLGDWSTSLEAAAAEVAYERGQLDRANTLITTALRGKDISRSDLSLRDQLATAYRVAKARGDGKRALTYLEAYKQVDDKARALAASTNAALMSARFDFANQNLRIGELRKGEAERDATIANARSRFLIVLLAAAGAIAGLLAFAYISLRRSRDEVRAANDDLSQSNAALQKALAARTEFLAMTSHEIRTPLNGILGMTQVLLADRAIETGIRGKIELVHGAGETMKALVDDLLDVAKMATGEIAVNKAPFDLGRLLREAGEVWTGQAQTQGLTLALDIEPGPLHIVEDEGRLRQIVFNLMSNAIKFTDRGEVRLSVSTLSAGAESGEERLRIAVTDTGIGIPTDKAEEIFESFRQIDSGTTRRHGGTGLGLSICRSLARALGGDVTVVSVPGAGSTFTLDLPLIRAAAEPARVAPSVAATGLAGARLLLVEANPLSQSVLRAVLTPHVAALTVAPNADEAANAIGRGEVDLVLADGATLGLDIDAAAALGRTAAASGACFALLWPAPDDDVRSAARSAGLDEPIAKPIAAPDLVAALHKSYRNSTSPEPAACAA